MLVNYAGYRREWGGWMPVNIYIDFAVCLMFGANVNSAFRNYALAGGQASKLRRNSLPNTFYLGLRSGH
ncbi:hypothetical protein MishRS11D_09180 [Methylomagnum ishizawai]|nr:hypothetical protein MishRS11D_09180 [Methylomagnum ishizawai]